MRVELCCPWRSVWAARALAAVALAVGVPLFLRMPPWCDLTLYQMAARNLIEGGTHYKDIFDTNLPGFVWALTLIQWAFGESVVVVRAADLLIVAGVVALIDRLAKLGGATAAARWWAVAGAAALYPFTMEMSHAQRDTWMALPGLAAVLLRVRRGIGGPAPLPSNPHVGSASAVLGAGLQAPDVPAGSGFAPAALEGALWGAALWVKPHIVLMAATVWLLTARRLAGRHPRPWRAAAFDLLGNLVGGLVVGAAGVLWLVASGAWGPFLEVFTEWNPDYLRLVRQELAQRGDQQLDWFPGWSLGPFVTVPLALLSVIDMAPWASRRAAGAVPGRAGPLGYWLPRHLWDKQAGADARFVRGTLGALYLVWLVQAFFLQRGFQYAHVPETLLMLGVWASHRWAFTFALLVWFALVAVVWGAAGGSPQAQAWLSSVPEKVHERYLPRHVAFNTERLKQWPVCWRTNLSDAERYALWDRLRLHPPHEAVVGWVEIAEVAEYLRAQGARDGEVVAWFDSPHVLYIIMHLKPGLRFMHVYTAISIGQGPDVPVTGQERVMAELAAAPANRRFVVSDLEWVALPATDPEVRARLLGPPGRPHPHHLLPAESPYPASFPFNQPTLFRSRGGRGRYVVHELSSRSDDSTEYFLLWSSAWSIADGADTCPMPRPKQRLILP
ncbi:hypothetical protein R5W24_003069 [Gemmata sp. JC717]|uniref:hypothetical protein n=1 Tax=Gemmata algarum TaxID=2975278 RepID=UPI0021BB8C1B|nr:hypothetical protein [Gemmata algarum]MDY3553955.1 hypothetical protein [Gemmata algarum]